MEKKNTILVAVCGVILVAFLAVATIKILQNTSTPPPAEEETHGARSAEQRCEQ